MPGVALCGLSLNVFAGGMYFFEAAPGWAQRAAFAAYFTWFGLMGWVFLAPHGGPERVAPGTARA